MSPSLGYEPEEPRERLPSHWHNSIVRYCEEDPQSLLSHPLNPKLHPKAQQDALAGAISEVGWIAPVIVNEVTQHVIDGHARIGLAISRGEPSVPVAYVHLSEDAELLALATFDPIGALAVADKDSLSKLLSGLSSANTAVAALLHDLAPDMPKVLHEDDADPTLPVDPITKPGDLWLLGQHRLLCGDATNASDVARVTMGEPAAAVITDPPYNVDFHYDEHTNDDKVREAYLAWTLKWFTLVRTCSPHCVVITCGIINLPMWLADVQRNHFALAWVRENSNSRNYIGTTSGFNVWEPILVYGKAKKCIPRDSFSIPISIQPAAEGHPCPKSLAAWSHLVESFTDPTDLVFDPFIGSGTTIIAAEQLGRRAYGLEISPAYCDLAIRRWEAITGQTATLDAGPSSAAESRVSGRD